ncbi:MAG: patatin-like phospholipase family protein [Pseudomonadota bacterium]
MSTESNIVEFPSNGSIEAQDEALQTELKETPVKPEPAGKSPAIALALGGGVARGWAHIGVLRAIDEANIPVSMIAGTSIGALVGGCYLAGKLDQLEEFARSITRTNILRYMDFAFRASGLITGTRLADKMDSEIGHLNIEDLDKKFVAIASDIMSGSEIWIETGSLSQAIRASYALPGVFQPVEHFGKQLVDGALVNPVPVSACRSFEEPIVVAVSLSSEVYGRASVVRTSTLTNNSPVSNLEETNATSSWFPFMPNGSNDTTRSRLGFTGVMIEAFNIIQDRITRSRMAGDPPDMVIRPKLADIGLSDFHKAGQAIDLGYNTAKTQIEALKEGEFAHLV